jgi:low affinity Fe/Cu permease
MGVVMLDILLPIFAIVITIIAVAMASAALKPSDDLSRNVGFGIGASIAAASATVSWLFHAGQIFGWKPANTLTLLIVTGVLIFAFGAVLFLQTNMVYNFDRLILGLICLSGLLIIGISLFVRAYFHLWPD